MHSYGAGESKFYHVDQQVQDPGELMVQMNSKGNLIENSLLLQETGLFVLYRLSTHWVRPTHILKSNLLMQSSLTKCSTHPKTPAKLT